MLPVHNPALPSHIAIDNQTDHHRLHHRLQANLHHWQAQNHKSAGSLPQAGPVNTQPPAEQSLAEVIGDPATEPTPVFKFDKDKLMGAIKEEIEYNNPFNKATVRVAGSSGFLKMAAQRFAKITGSKIGLKK